ncbi:MAG TPA: ROK family protein [Spirochaetia bacterium]|nr:ROK family protein [Spirochaetia bacterium]
MEKRPTDDQRSKVLQTIYFLKKPTRGEIVRATGMSPVSVTATIRELLDEGLVEKAGKLQIGTGRPSTQYRLGCQMGHTVGISVNTRGFRIAAVDVGNRIVFKSDHQLELSTNPADHVDDIVRQISSGLKAFFARSDLATRRPIAIGVSLPGMVDTERGVWLQGLQVSGIAHIPLREIVEKLSGLLVVVEDMARCLAFLEAERRGPAGSDHLVFLCLDDGVGTGIIINGEPYAGAHGLAGEVGHLVVDEGGERCACGNIGCLETVVSQSSILRRFKQRLSEGVISVLQRFRTPGAEPLTLEAIRDAARSGDRLARSTLFEVGTLLGDACGKIIKLYNPRTLVIGGPVAVLGEFFQEAMWIKIRQNVIPEMLKDLTLDISPSGPDDQPLGAAMLATRRFWKRENALHEHGSPKTD